MQVKRIIFASVFAFSALSLPCHAASFDPFEVSDLAQKNAFVAFDAAPSCDALGELTGALSVQQAVMRALCTSPQVNQAIADSQVAAAGVGKAMSGYMPRIMFNLDYAWTEQRFDKLKTNTKIEGRTDSLSLNWQLFDFGRTKAKVAQSKALVDVSNNTQTVVVQQIVLNALSTYFEAVVALAQWQARQQAVDVARKTLDVVEGRYRGGASAKDELLQAKSRHAQALLVAQQAEDIWQTRKGLLANILALPFTQPIKLPNPETLSMSNQQFLAMSLEQHVDYAMLKHPRVIMAMAQQQAALAQIDVAHAEYLPSLSLSAQYQNSPQPSNILTSPDSQSVIGLQLNVPLLQGFEVNYLVREAEADARSKGFAIEQEKRQILADVWQFYQEWKTTDRQRASLLKIVDLATQLEEITQARYRAGVGSMFDWLEAQKLLAEAQAEYAQRLSESISAQLRLAGATGRLQLTIE